MARHKKTKTKASEKKHHSHDSYISEENHVSTLEEISNRTLNELNNLGTQKFALPPFREHFDRWLMNLKSVLTDFESNPNLIVDDQFVKERSRLLSDIELELKERRLKEAASEQVVKDLSDNKTQLEKIEIDYNAGTRRIEDEKNTEIKHLNDNIESLKQELDRIKQIKTGLFRTVSKTAKAQKETEATQKLNSAQEELTSTLQKFKIEQENLRNEYEEKKQPIIEKNQEIQKEIQDQENDGSLGIRQSTCETLVKAVNELLQRASSLHHTAPQP